MMNEASPVNFCYLLGKLPVLNY